MVWYSTGKRLDFDSLNLHLLVAGEMEVILSGELSELEKTARLNIGRDLLFNAGFY